MEPNTQWQIELRFIQIAVLEGNEFLRQLWSAKIFTESFMVLIIYLRVYFSDRLYAEDELPAEFKLYLPVKKAANEI